MCNFHTPTSSAKKAKAVSLYEFDGLGKVPVTESSAGKHHCQGAASAISPSATPSVPPDAVEPMEFVQISAPTHRDDLLGQRLPLRRP